MSEELIVRYCAPTLAGIKTGNVFSCECSDVKKANDCIRKLNMLLCKKGLRIMPLRYTNNRLLVYVFRPQRLCSDLKNVGAIRILEQRGYNCNAVQRCVIHLIERLSQQQDFPHEIGLFLGYPPEDVCGFIENKACDCKCVGCWKVYGDEISAQKLFEKYKKCSSVYFSKWESGRPIEKLTVAKGC